MKRKQTILTLLLAIGIGSVLIANSFGALHMGMMTQEDGLMMSCPFTPGQSFCSMTLVEMIEAALDLFVFVPMVKDASLLVLALLIVGVAAFLWKPPLLQKSFILAGSTIYFKYIHRGYLQELFSCGILHPKIYNTLHVAH